MVRAKEQYCVFNVTRQSFLSLGVSPAEARPGRLRLRSDEGMTAFPIDEVYLDSGDTVIHVVERLGPLPGAPPRIRCSRMLELPAKTAVSSNTQAGDQLLISTPERMRDYWDLESRERRRMARSELPLFACYRTGPTSAAHRVRDISLSGAYILTQDRRSFGTVMDVTLHYRGTGKDPAYICAVRSVVVRYGPDGMGIHFLHRRGYPDRENLATFLASSHATA
ncbi:MAG: PilZ domain-containing protein [Bryobacteraceae bacterium]